jgi:hypothetical protein
MFPNVPYVVTVTFKTSVEGGSSCSLPRFLSDGKGCFRSAWFLWVGGGLWTGAHPCRGGGDGHRGAGVFSNPHYFLFNITRRARVERLWPSNNLLVFCGPRVEWCVGGGSGSESAHAVLSHAPLEMWRCPSTRVGWSTRCWLSLKQTATSALVGQDVGSRGIVCVRKDHPCCMCCGMVCACAHAGRLGKVVLRRERYLAALARESCVVVLSTHPIPGAVLLGVRSSTLVGVWHASAPCLPPQPGAVRSGDQECAPPPPLPSLSQIPPHCLAAELGCVTVGLCDSWVCTVAVFP